MGRTKNERLCEQGYKEKFVTAFANKSVECDQEETKQTWTKMKEDFVSSSREVCGCAKA